MASRPCSSSACVAGADDKQSRLVAIISRLKGSPPQSKAWLISEWREKRQSPAGCLTCGSRDIAKLPLEVEPTPFAMPHPGCGGIIRKHQSEERIAMRVKTRAYTAEGEFISATIGKPE